MRGLTIIYIVIAILIISVVGYYALVFIQKTTPTQTPSPTTPAYIEVVDFANRTIRVPRNISRIVAIGPGALRLVVYLNATNMVVGIEDSEKRWGPLGRDYAMAVYEKLKNLSVIGPGGPGKPPNPELILSVKPDLVIMSSSYAQVYDPDRLQKEVGAPVIVVDYTPATSPDLSLFYRALRLLGTVLNRGERAEELINYTQSILDDLRKRVEGLNTSLIKVYVGAVSYKGPQPFTASQSPYPPLWWLSTRSVTDSVAVTRGIKGFITIDFDYLIATQPDVIFIDENNLNTVLQDFNRSPSKYCSLKAFRDGRVYGVLPYNWYHTNLAVAFANAYYIGKVLYPDRFADIDPVAKANEIFIKFVGVPLYQKYVEGGYPGYVNLTNMFRCG